MASDSVGADAPAAPPLKLAVVGASAGGVEALRALAAALPADLACAVVVVLHIASSGTSVLAQILDRAGPLPATTAAAGDALEPGHIYVAPPDCHVLVDAGALALSGGPRENGHRPAIDPAMRSAAAAYGAACCGVVLSGTRDDGSAGLAAIKRAGGAALVQDPAEALYGAMPSGAIANVAVDVVARVVDLAAWLAHAAGGRPAAPGPRQAASEVAGGAFSGGGPTPAGTRFTCPECGGVLWEALENGVVQLRCSVGHVYSPESLTAEHGRELERALWVALRSLEDRSQLMQRLAERAAAARHERSAQKFARHADDAAEHAALIRRLMDRFAEAPDVGSGAELA
jgi:two-component system, chemotaxis family, protein-glutamate methylesterase/glutaminase